MLLIFDCGGGYVFVCVCEQPQWQNQQYKIMNDSNNSNRQINVFDCNGDNQYIIVNDCNSDNQQINAFSRNGDNQCITLNDPNSGNPNIIVNDCNDSG